MANHNRKKSRIRMPGGNMGRARLARIQKTGVEYCWYGRTPAWWNIMRHHRPSRRKTKEMEGRIVKGEDFENMAWPVSRKPHIYYY